MFGRPVWTATSEFLTWSFHLTPRIWRWQLIWKDWSLRLSSASSVHISKLITIPTIHTAYWLYINWNNPDFWLSEPNIGTPVTPILGNVHINICFFLCLFVLELIPYRRDGQTDRQTRHILRPITTAAQYQYDPTDGVRYLLKCDYYGRNDCVLSVREIYLHAHIPVELILSMLNVACRGTHSLSTSIL